MRLDLESTPSVLPVFRTDVFDDFDSFNDAGRLLERGVAAAQSGDRDSARKILTQVVAIDPSCEDAWMWLASISDYPEELLAFLNRVLAIDPENSRAIEWHKATMSLMARMFVKRAVAAHTDGNTELASYSLDQALAYDENCEDAWAWKASITDNEDDQLGLLRRVLEINPENEEAAEAVRQIEHRRAEERRLEQERRAEEERLAAEAARREEERRAEEARLAAEAARIEEERRQEEVRAAEQRRVEALFVDAKTAAMSDNNGLALELINEYLEKRGTDAEAWVLRSHLSQSVEEKLASLRQALALDPDHVVARTTYDFLSSISNPSVAGDATIADTPSNTAIEDRSKIVATVIVEDPAAHMDLPIEEHSFELSSVDGYLENEAFDPYATIAPSVVAEPESPLDDVDQLAFENSVESVSPFEPVIERDHAEPDHAPCPFCGAAGQASSFQCGDCCAVLSMSDLEAVLANDMVDRSIVSGAVVALEAEWNARDFNTDELVVLALGHLNLGSNESGRQYLKEALSLEPNNVVLASQLNALSIRLDEIDRQREADEARPKGKTILVVDDSATVRRLISGKLEKSGHNVISACDGVEALERLSEQVPDLVLLDITMPRMDGYEVCKQIRSHPTCSNIPVVMISGKDGFFDKVRGRMAGTTAYVTKPFGPETLMKALEMYLVPDAAAHFEPQYEEELEAVV